jgi:hypothetical protein
VERFDLGNRSQQLVCNCVLRFEHFVLIILQGAERRVVPAVVRNYSPRFSLNDFGRDDHYDRGIGRGCGSVIVRNL